MKNSNQDGRTLRDLVETALAGSAVAGAANAAGPEGQTAEIAKATQVAEVTQAVGPESHLSTVVVGEVLDTHHPHLPGRVLVRWLDHQGILLDRWLQRERHLSLRKADRVLLTLPAGWREWVVTGALGRESSEPTEDLENASNVRLGPGEALRILSHEGRPLMTLRQGSEGPIVELGEGNVELTASRTLRLRADTIEIVSAAGGTDLRTEGDTVVRARTIRLN